MLDLRQAIQSCASLAKNIRKAADAVGIRVTEKNPLRLLQPVGDSAEAGSEVATEFSRRDEPRRDWIKCFVFHNRSMVPDSGSVSETKPVFEHGMYQLPIHVPNLRKENSSVRQFTVQAVRRSHVEGSRRFRTEQLKLILTHFHGHGFLFPSGVEVANQLSIGVRRKSSRKVYK